MKVIFSKKYTININHKFKTEKFEKTFKLLLKNKIINKEDVISPNLPDAKTLSLGHSKKYINKLLLVNFTKKEEELAEIPLIKKIIKIHMLHVDGTIKAADLALKYGYCAHCGGGSHHAHYNYASGFCILNDIAITAKYLIKKGLKKVLVIDLDVHQGDGTVDILKDEKKAFTFSMHSSDIYPKIKNKSSLDIGLKSNTKGKEYLRILKKSLLSLKKIKPDFIIYNAGADVYKDDMLGNLKLSIKDIKERDKIVFKFAQKNNLPIVVTLSGGYSKDINKTIKIHYNTIKTMKEVFEIRSS